MPLGTEKGPAPPPALQFEVRPFCDLFRFAGIPYFWFVVTKGEIITKAKSAPAAFFPFPRCALGVTAAFLLLIWGAPALLPCAPCIRVLGAGLDPKTCALQGGGVFPSPAAPREGVLRVGGCSQPPAHIAAAWWR